MGSIFKAPKIPAPPPIQEPDVSDVPSAEDEARKAQEEEDMRRRNRNRKGRRSTILTGPQGLDEIGDDNINKKTLLGG